MESPNNLVACYPQIKRWWNYDKNAPDLPEEYTLFSPKRAYFKCPDCGAESYRRITDAFTIYDGDVPSIFRCPFCAEKLPLSGFNTVIVKHPELIHEEWAHHENMFLGIDPDNILDTNTEKVWWKCPTCKHLYLMSVRDRLHKKKRKHNPCTFCNGRRIPSPRTIL